MPAASPPCAPGDRIDTGFDPLAAKLVRGFWAAGVLLTLVALAVAWFAAPADTSRNWRLACLHVPAAWLALTLYVAMAGCAALVLAREHRIAAATMVALAPIGALFSIAALWTGVVWSRSTAGGHWLAWDARLACVVILLFLFGTVIAFGARLGERACALLVLVGILNLPIIYFSLAWWNQLHENVDLRTGRLNGGPAGTVLAEMSLFTLAFGMYAAAVVLTRVRSLMAQQRYS